MAGALGQMLNTSSINCVTIPKASSVKDSVKKCKIYSNKNLKSTKDITNLKISICPLKSSAL